MTRINFQGSTAGLFQSVRGFKYAFHEAIADIVDNSVDAEANSIEVITDKKQDRILIIDNGDGMNGSDLEKAITPWYSPLKDRQKDVRTGKRGKYGIGLKSAGFSLGKQISIHTQRLRGEFHFLTLDLDTLSDFKKDKDFVEASNVKTELYEKYLKSSGTIIEITDINKRKVTAPNIDSLRGRLGLLFYRLILDGEIEIKVSNAPVVPIDPLLSDLKKNSSKNFYHFYGTKTITHGKSKFKVSCAHIGRGAYWNEKERRKYKYFLGAGNKTRISDQGLYIQREKRLVTTGGWLGHRQLSHHNAPTRVLIEYDARGDEIMGIDHTKTKPEIEKDLWDKFDSFISKCVNDSEKRFRAEGEKNRIDNQKNKGTPELKARILQPESVNRLMQKEERLLPSYKESQTIKEEQLQAEAAQSEEWLEIVDDLAYRNLWDFKVNKDDEIILYLNESHPGYQALWFTDDEDELRQHLNLFFYTMAVYEADFGAEDTNLDEELKAKLKTELKRFRRYVSKHFPE